MRGEMKLGRHRWRRLEANQDLPIKITPSNNKPAAPSVDVTTPVATDRIHPLTVTDNSNENKPTVRHRSAIRL